jgi:hypothetical protein
LIKRSYFFFFIKAKLAFFFIKATLLKNKKPPCPTGGPGGKKIKKQKRKGQGSFAPAQRVGPFFL